MSHPLAIDVYGSSYDFCQDIQEMADESLQYETNTLDADSDIEVSILNDSEVSNVKDLLNAKQQTILADAGSRSDTVTAFEKKINESLNEKQQTYFRQEKMRDETEETKADSDRRWLKYSGIGFILGTFIFACIMLILYMTGDKVRTINEAESMFGTRCLQSVALSEIKASRADIIKKWGIHLVMRERNTEMSIDDAIRMVTDEIIHRLEDDKGTLFINVEQNILDRLPLKDSLNIKSAGAITVAFGETEKDPNAFNSLLDSDAAIFISVVDITTRKGLRQFHRVCAQNKIPILGYIGVRY